MAPSDEVSLEERNKRLADAVGRKCLDGYFVVFTDSATATAILNRPGKGMGASVAEWGILGFFMWRKERRIRLSVDAAGQVVEQESTG